MDARQLFWTVALLDLSAVLAVALVGVRHVRQGRWREHRNAMLAAVVLIVLFLGAYLLKLRWLGHEDVAAWTPLQVLVLRAHEVGIAAMLGGGLYAGWRAFRFRGSLPAEPLLAAGDPASAQRVGHRWAGRVAVAGAGLAWATAILLLAGMYGRSG